MDKQEMEKGFTLPNINMPYIALFIWWNNWILLSQKKLLQDGKCYWNNVKREERTKGGYSTRHGPKEITPFEKE